MTSEGIQLNVGGGDVEGVTCTVIEGVAYNQMCQSDVPTFQNSISHTDTMTGMLSCTQFEDISGVALRFL